MPNFEQRIRSFCSEYNLSVDGECLNNAEVTYRYEMEELLFSAFQEVGSVSYAETGTSPAEYLPDVVGMYLSLLDQPQWDIESLTSEDGWDTASVILKNNEGSTNQFTINGIENSDWVPGDLSNKMRLFSKKYADKTLITFFSDDPYLVLALPHVVAEELELIIDEFSQSID